MRCNNEKSKVYNSGRGITGQALLYQHMSNHYRRILNAKKSVDNAPPVTYKPRRISTYSLSSSPVRSITSNNKRFPCRNVSPALTDRTGSNYSNGCSCCGAESYYGGKCQTSQNNECCCRAKLEMRPNPSAMELINQIAFDTKLGPADCFEASWKDAKNRTSFSRFRSPYEAKKTGNRAIISGNNKKTGSKSILPSMKRKLSQKDKASSDLMEKHSKFFMSHNNSFCPRILKTNATSKIKSLKVYHPPRKRNGTTGASHWKEQEKEVEEKPSMEPVDMMKSKCNGVSVCENTNNSSNCKCKQSVNARESQTSSRDSAYNGGVSSLPESRSPTPDQRKQKLCCSCRKESDGYYENVRSDGNIVVPNLKLTDNQDTQTEPTQTSDRKINQSQSRENCERVSRPKRLDFKVEEHSNRKTSLTSEEERDYAKRKIKEEALYTTFIKDITAEVLEKGLYTNKALKKVMKRHVLSNLWLLDKERMLKEIDKLRMQLGIPEDEDLMNIRIGSSGSAADIEECYTVISDSQLTEPSFRSKQETNMSDEMMKQKRPSYSDEHVAELDKPFPKSISDVLSRSNESNEIALDTDSDDEDEELISVIHVTKMVKEKKRNESQMMELYSDESRNATQEISADESEQSSDNITRKKKPHTRFRKVEKTSSSSDDLESGSVNRQRFHGNKSDSTRKTLSPKKRDVAMIARRPEKSELDGSNE